MNEKDFNLQVLAKLVEIAKEIFAKLTISKEGTYTAAELWNGKNAFGESIVIDYKGTESEIYTAEIGTFKMQVTPQKLWYVLWKFERLCNVKQADKMRFTYGKQEGENISEKTMYLDRSSKEVTRKKSLVKLSERVAVEPDKKTKSYNMYYFVAGLWYLIAQNFDERQYKAIQERIDKDDNYLFGLLQRWDFNTENRLNPIYKALFEALKSERVKHTPEERKGENEPKNTVIREIVTGKTEMGALHVEQREVKAVGNGLYKDSNNLYFEYGRYLYILGGYTRGVATFLKEQLDIKAKIVSMIEEGGICTESAKILYEKLTGHTLGKTAKAEPAQEETHEDYPPEPYNETGKTSCNDEAVSKPERKSIRATFARQKVFPTELYYARRKIRRFKRLSFAGYTNYHSHGESFANRTQTAKTSYCLAAMARGSPKTCIFVKKRIMKVFLNKRKGLNSGGMLLVAAHNSEEAHEVFHDNRELSHMWNEWDGITTDFYYERKNWEELVGMNYDTETPCVIDESGYSE